MKMEFDQNAIMATMNPLVLIGCFAVITAIAFFSARRYRDTNDFKKSSILYGGMSICAAGVFMIAGVPGVMAAGCVIGGFGIMSLFSNYYFNHD